MMRSVSSRRSASWTSSGQSDPTSNHKQLMRIVGGRLADTPLISPAGRVRPTTEVLRDAWMKELGDALKGSRILDLFAGSGAIGIEAFSRGARYADFVENHPSALHALKANIA